MQLGLLREHGYELATATNGSEGLRLFMSRPVDAVVLEHDLGLLDGVTIADEIKQVRPEVPIVMWADNIELPSDALKSIDALVAKSDGPHFLLATLHFVLNVRPAQRHEARVRTETPAHLRRPSKSRERPNSVQANHPESAADVKGAPFPKEVWRSIRNGSVRF
ncbi:MAG: response regulator [Terriglobales bacterium]